MKSYLGIDVSKLHLDLSRPAPARRLANTQKAILSWLKSLPPETILVCEASGGYEALLLRLAHALHRPVILLNARQVRDFARAQNRLAKTDRIDAGVIAEFARTFQPNPLSLPDPLQEQLVAMVKHRSHLLTQITQNNNLTQTVTDKNLLRLIAKTVAFLQKQVAQLEVLIETKIAASPDLLAKVNRLRQVQGIGRLTATSLVALMPELGSLSDTQADALAGVAPFNHDSGQFRGQRHIFGGRSQVRSVLYMAALVASRHNPILRTLYLHLLTRGKAKKLALTALMRKLIVLANHLLKNPDFLLAI
ncbi:MAG: IS110 family transposase [Chthoniobacterales bacterium]